MARKQIQARVPDDMAEQIEEYQEDGEFMNETEVIRSLLRRGLEAEEREEETDPTDWFLTRLASRGVLITSFAVLLLGIGAGIVAGAAIQAGNFGVGVPVTYAGFAAFVGGAIATGFSAVARLTVSRADHDTAGSLNEATQ